MSHFCGSAVRAITAWSDLRPCVPAADGRRAIREHGGPAQARLQQTEDELSESTEVRHKLACSRRKTSYQRARRSGTSSPAADGRRAIREHGGPAQARLQQTEGELSESTEVRHKLACSRRKASYQRARRSGTSSPAADGRRAIREHGGPAQARLQQTEGELSESTEVRHKLACSRRKTSYQRARRSGTSYTLSTSGCPFSAPRTGGWPVTQAVSEPAETPELTLIARLPSAAGAQG